MFIKCSLSGTNKLPREKERGEREGSFCEVNIFTSAPALLQSVQWNIGIVVQWKRRERAFDKIQPSWFKGRNWRLMWRGILCVYSCEWGKSSQSILPSPASTDYRPVVCPSRTTRSHAERSASSWALWTRACCWPDFEKHWVVSLMRLSSRLGGLSHSRPLRMPRSR